MELRVIVWELKSSPLWGREARQWDVYGRWLIPVSMIWIDLLNIAAQPLGRISVHRRVTPPGHIAQVYSFIPESRRRDVIKRILPALSPLPGLEPETCCMWSSRVHQIYKGLLIMRNSLHLGYHFVRLVIKTPQKKFHAFPKILKGANGAAKIRHFEKKFKNLKIVRNWFSFFLNSLKFNSKQH